MADKEIKWKVPKKRQPVWWFFGKIFHLFYNVKEVVNVGEKLPKKCIIVSNHHNKRGPMVYELNMPIKHATWGAYQMLGNYKMRFKYLRDVLYIQKNGKKKFPATLKAGFEAFFSIFVYRGMKIIPSFPDARLRKTIQYSMEVLDSGMAVSVYPEDSNDGYFEEMGHFFPGFVMLAQQYYKKTGEDLPVYPVYYGQNKKKIVIGTPLYVQQLANEGKNREEIAEVFRQAVNELYYDHFKD